MQWKRTASKLRIFLALGAALGAGAAPAAELTITRTGDLGFGSFVAGAGGTVTVAPSGARSASGVFLIPSSQGAAARFEVRGDGDAGYTIGLPAEAVLDNGAGQTMTLRDFTSAPSAFGRLSLGGTQTISVGATLNVGANQASGSYSGTFSVTVNYQ
jgi:hypothetical protein